VADRWIVIPGWDKFQHRDAGRSGRGVIWIRDYADQHHKDAYRDLPYHLRGLLRDLRLAFASSQGQVKLQPTSLGRRFGQRTRLAHIERLAEAGFIVISASKPPALSQQAAGLDVDVDVPPNPRKRGRAKPSDNGSVVCPHCGIALTPPLTLTEHVHLQHGGGDAPSTSPIRK
jgi:hypothetical protein